MCSMFGTHKSVSMCYMFGTYKPVYMWNHQVLPRLVCGCKIFKDAAYLAAAKVCGEVIWHRGLLRKGCGLCHGAAGNAYSILALYQSMHEPRYLYQAYKVGRACGHRS